MKDILVILNQEFHLADFERNFKLINDAEKTRIVLLVIPYVIDIGKLDNFKIPYYVVNSPFIKRFGCINPFLLIEAKNAINNFIRENENLESVFFYSEQDLLTQYAISNLRRMGSKIFLVEENGILPYVLNNIETESDILLASAKIKYLPALMVLGLKTKTNLVNINSGEWKRLPDYMIDGIIYYEDIGIKRCIKQFFVANPQRRIEQGCSKPDEVALYLSQPLYESYMSRDEYVEFTKKSVLDLCRKYERVIFKFHPREDRSIIDKTLQTIMMKFDILEILSETGSVEGNIFALNANHIYGFMSSGLINLERMGFETFFLFTRWEKYKESNFLCILESVLKERKSIIFEEVDAERSGYLCKVNKLIENT